MKNPNVRWSAAGPTTLVQTFMVPSRWILLTLAIPWLFPHHEVDMCGCEWVHYFEQISDTLFNLL